MKYIRLQGEMSQVEEVSTCLVSPPFLELSKASTEADALILPRAVGPRGGFESCLCTIILSSSPSKLRLFLDLLQHILENG